MGSASWQPKWWTQDDASAWTRVREAMKRDWEQTKADLSGGGRELDQDVNDTIKQAVGKDVIPPRTTPNVPGGTPAAGTATSRAWNDDVEGPFAYGYGARRQFGQGREWDDQLEGQLSKDWEGEGGVGNTLHRKWEDVKDMVRRGFERART